LFEKNRSLEAVLGISGLKEKFEGKKGGKINFTHDAAIIAQSKAINYHASAHTKEI
jgi:hypothetical protein